VKKQIEALPQYIGCRSCLPTWSALALARSKNYESKTHMAVSPNPQDLKRPRRWLGVLACVFLGALGLGAAPVRAQPEYLLAPGDILKISVFKNADLSLDVRVSESGAIGYPLIGSVPVKGLTLPAAEAKIAQMLRDGGFVVNPQVNI
jgi:protein involved in polysaccharide export with SLBB domain